MNGARPLAMRALLSFSAGLLVTLLTVAASANGSGIPGKSGKNGSCNGCHNGGTAPTVKIDGPASLAANATGQYTFTVTTAAPKGSAGISADNGKLTAGENLKLSGEELTHSAPVDVTGGAVVFKFSVKAPASGKIKIYAAGLASDGTGQTGDGEALTTKDVTVNGGGSTTSGGDDDDEPAAKSSSSGGSDEEVDDDTGIPNSGCAAAHGSRGDALGGPAMLAVVFALALATKRRRNPR